VESASDELVWVDRQVTAEQRRRRFVAIGAAVVAAIALIQNIVSSDTDKPAATIPPVTTIAPGGVPYKEPVPGDFFRYEYQGYVVLCTVPHEKHVVKPGETLYGIAQTSTGASDYDMDFMLPTIDKLNVDRGIVKDPDVLKVGDKVLTIAGCNIYYWLNFDDHWEGAIIDVGNHTFARYDYSPSTDQYGKIEYCAGNVEQCAKLGYSTITTHNYSG